MDNYEPELMYALDSNDEFADLKNVYDVRGDVVLYCPICLGKVKLWNGQDPTKNYKKQKCFHHIDGMCSHENRVHFAYKIWLMNPGSKFSVNNGKEYTVIDTRIEKTLTTKYGNYRPDIIVEVENSKIFYVEIADTNKKTDDYIMKWDELGNDVIEIDVNDQMWRIKNTDAPYNVPDFKLIYSSDIGKCYTRKYVKKEYEDIFTERKIYWKRNDIVNYKIKWELLDWFWRDVQDYYNNKKEIDNVIESFQQLDESDQEFVCNKLNGKHSALRCVLEANSKNEKIRYESKIKQIDKIIRSLNKIYSLSSSSYPYLCRKYDTIKFVKDYYWIDEYNVKIDTEPQDVYTYFINSIQDYFETEETRKNNLKIMKDSIKKLYEPILSKYKSVLDNSKNSVWEMDYSQNKRLNYVLEIRLFYKTPTFYQTKFILYTNPINEISNIEIELRNLLTERMKYLIVEAKDAFSNDIRIMEEQ